MNQRVVLIVLVATFVTCFVGTCAVGTLTVVKTASSGLEEALPRPAKVDLPLTADEPMESEAPPPDVQPTPALPGEEDDFAPEYEPVVEGIAQFAVFHPTKPKVDPWGALQKAAKNGRVTVYRGEAPEEAQPPFIALSELTTRDYEVLTGTPLDEGKGLTAADKAALPKAKTVSVFDVTVSPGVSQMQDVTRVLAAFATATGGVLWDEETQQYLSTEAWQVRRVKSWDKGVPFITMHTVVFVSPGERGVDLRTSGLRHFGQPELELKGVSRSSSEAAVSLVNATAQLLVEGAEVAAPSRKTVSIDAIRHPEHRKSLLGQCGPNASKRVELELRPGKIPGDSTLTIAFDGSGSPSERIEKALSDFFGSTDRVDPVEHDEALRKLSEAQMAIFEKTIKPRFKKGLKPGEVLMVKAPFATNSGGTEWMWVEVTRIKDDGEIEGFLANDPDDVPDLVDGSEVIVEERELFDWLLEQKDGTSLGNETGKVMRERLGR